MRPSTNQPSGQSDDTVFPEVEELAKADARDCFQFEAPYGHYSNDMQQLLIILISHVVADGIPWTSEMLHRFLKPSLSPPQPRRLVLQTLHEIAKMPSTESTRATSVKVSGETLRGFIRPFLSTKRPLRAFQSSPIRTISSMLDQLGLHLDEARLLIRRHQLLVSCFYDEKPRSPLLIGMNLQVHVELDMELTRVKQELDDPLDGRIARIIALDHCSDLTLWAETCEAELAINEIMQNFEQERSRRNRLASLIACYIIHLLFFGPSTASSNEPPRLPSHLSLPGVSLFGQAVQSYSECFCLGVTLDSLTERKFNKLSFERMGDWRNFWPQHDHSRAFGEASESHLSTEVTDQSSQLAKEAEDICPGKSEWRFWEFLTGCWSRE